MLELEALQATRNQDQRAQARLKKARHYYLVGMTCLKAAIENNRRDTHLYEKASELFLRSIRFNRAESEAYLALAYLLLLFNEPMRAIPYIQHVLHQAPHNSEALKLNQQALNQVSIHQAQATETESEPEPLQPQRLKIPGMGQSKSSELDKALTMAQRLSQGIKTTCQTEVLQRLEQLEQRLGQKYTDIFKHLPEQGIQPETQEQLNAYQNILADLKYVIETSEHLVSHQESLEYLLDEVEDLIETLEEKGSEHKQPGMLLNQFFERYEVIADAVDLLETQHVDIGELSPLFDELAQALGDLQEMIKQK